MDKSKTKQQLLLEIEELRTRLEEAEETLRAIRSGEVDALVVADTQGDRVYTLQGADRSYRILLETMEEGAATLGNDGTILYCNRRLVTMLEAPLEKVTGSSIGDYLLPADWEKFSELLKEGNEVRRSEFELQTIAGHRVPANLSLGSLPGTGMPGFCLTAADLTGQKRVEEALRTAHGELEERVKDRTKELSKEIEDRKRVEEELRESEERFRNLVKYAPAVIYEMDLQGTRLLSVNDAMCEVTEYSREELLSMKPIDFLDQESKSVFQERIRKTLAGEELDETVEYRIRRKDGEWIYATINAGALTYPKDTPSRVVVIAYDVTERKKIEEALRLSEERYRQLVRHAPAGIYEVDFTTGRFTEVNDAMSRILGYTHDELLAMTPFDILDDEGRARFASRIRLARSGEGLEEAAEYLVRTKNGRLIWALLNVTFRWDGGKIVGATVVAHDITERKRIEEEIRRSHDELELRVQERTAELAGAFKELQEEIARREKAEQQLRLAQRLEAIGTLTGGIAHDFNNILGAVVINSEMALLDLPGGSGLRTNLDLILKAGLRGKDLVKQMLLFSRKAEKKQEITTLPPLIKETFKLLRSSIPTTIQMKLLLETETDAVSADPSQIQQVIMNLCTNAAYAMRGTTGSIDISLQGITFGSTDLPEADMEPGDYLVLSVEDTGSGMDEEVKKRIFEPFFTTKPTGEGTGLGLSVVYGIVKNHKGGITVHSEPGKGSIFRVYLPKVDSGALAAPEIPKPIPRGNERILLVDDEEFNIKTVQNMLQHLGYKVTALMDSREALTLFSANPSQFDLVITDQTMPFMTGEDLGKEFMRMRPDIPVILCTGYSDLISSEKAAALGFRGYIMKPFTVREGAELVRRVLDQKGVN